MDTSEVVEAAGAEPETLAVLLEEVGNTPLEIGSGGVGVDCVLVVVCDAS